MTLSGQWQSSHSPSPVCWIHSTLQPVLHSFLFRSATTPSSSGPLLLFLRRTLPFTSSGTWHLASACFKQPRSCSDLCKTARKVSATPCFSFCTKLGHPGDLWKEYWQSHPLLHTIPGLHPSPALLMWSKRTPVSQHHSCLSSPAVFRVGKVDHTHFFFFLVKTPPLYMLSTNPQKLEKTGCAWGTGIHSLGRDVKQTDPLSTRTCSNAAPSSVCRDAPRNPTAINTVP